MTSDAIWTFEISGISRKFQTMQFERKVIMNSPTEFSAKIEYSDDINFMDRVEFKRNGIVEWAGYIEDKKSSWDNQGRYLDLGGRDASFILWKKYIEDFSNFVAKTAGFFGSVNAVELMQFFLRSPASDPNHDQFGNIEWYFNKEGWGIDSTRMTCTASVTAQGDPTWTILRRRGLGWRSRGNPYSSADKTVDGVSGSFTNWNGTGSSPYLNDLNNANYIKSVISGSVDGVANFTLQDSPTDLTTINSIGLQISFKNDSSIWWWDYAEFEVWVWCSTVQAWHYCFSQHSAGQTNINWTSRIADLTGFIINQNDINNMIVSFRNKAGATLSTYIGYTKLTFSYVASGKQVVGDYFLTTFPTMEIMGMYFESRMDDTSYPRNYKISASTGSEDYSLWHEVDPNSHITLIDNSTIEHDSYQNETAYLDKHYTPSPMGDFDIWFSFKINSSVPYPYAFIPFCLSEQYEEDYYTMVSTAGHYFSAIEIANTNGTLSIRGMLKDSTGTYASVSIPLTTSDLLPSITYYVRVFRSGSTIYFAIHNDSSMNEASLVYEAVDGSGHGLGYSWSQTTGADFHYRFQTLTYNNEDSWSYEFDNDMDEFLTNGEQILNGSFEDATDFHYWFPTNLMQISTLYHHGSGSKSCLAGNGFNMDLHTEQTFKHISKTSVTSFTFWWLADWVTLTDTTNASFILEWSDSSTTIISIAPTIKQIWQEVDVITGGYWDSGKILTGIKIDYQSPNSGGANYYIDEISLIVTNPSYSSFDLTGGTATRSTDYAQKAQGDGSQKIVATTGYNIFYFEKDLLAAPHKRAAEWVCLPSPDSTSVDEILLAGSFTEGGTPCVDSWCVYGTSPYIAFSDSDNNHVWQTVVGIGDTDIWYFNPLNAYIDAKYSSFAPNGSQLKIRTRLQSGSSGSLEVWVYSKHDGIYHDAGAISVTSSSWTETDISLDSILTCYDDWNDIKVKIVVTALDAGSIQVGYAPIEAKGTAYCGKIFIMNLWNSGIVSGPNPSNNFAGRLSAIMSPTATSDQDKWRFQIEAYDYLTGTYYYHNAIADSFVQESNIWVFLMLYIYQGASAYQNGYVKLYYNYGTGTENLLCEIDNLTGNLDVGKPDRVDFEIDCESSYTGTAWLDSVSVRSAGAVTHTDCTIYGGPNWVDVVNVNHNVYRDCVYSWQPITSNALKIQITSPNDTPVVPTGTITVTNLSKDITGVGTNFTAWKSGDYIYLPSIYTVDNWWQIESIVDDNNLTLYNTYTSATEIGVTYQMKETETGWAISQVYVYKTQPIKIRPYLDGLPDPTPIPNTPYVYYGGPYINAVDLSGFTFTAPVGPLNVSRQRLLDAFNSILTQCYEGSYVTFEWWIGLDAYNTLYVAAQKGTDISSIITFRSGENMGGSSRDQFIHDTCQRVYVVGEGEQATQQQASIWVENNEGMSDVRTFYEDVDHEKNVSPDDKGNVGVADLIGEVYLKNNYKRRDQIQITLTKDDIAREVSARITGDISYTLGYDVGDIVKVVDDFNKINDTYRIMNIQKTIDNNGETITITLGYPLYRFEDEVAGLYKQLKMVQAVGVLTADWTSEGIDANKISAAAIGDTSAFTHSARNDEIQTDKDMRSGLWNTDPVTTGSDYSNAYQKSSGSTHGMEWDKTTDWMALLGPTDTGGPYTLRVAIMGEDVPAMVISGRTIPATTEPIDITLDRNPKVTVELKCFSGYGDKDTDSYPPYWFAGNSTTDPDYFIIGLRGNVGTANVGTASEYTNPTGFWFRGVKTDVNEITLYMEYSFDGVTVTSNIMRTLKMNHKYKLELVTESTSGIIMYNVYDIDGTATDEENPLQMVVRIGTSYVGTLLPTLVNLSVKPLYMMLGAWTDGSTEVSGGETVQTYRAILYIYKYSCTFIRVLGET